MKTLEIFNKHTGNNIIHDPNIISAMQEYAEQYAKEALRLASEGLIEWSYERHPNFRTAREAILSENNLPKHI